MSSGVYQRKLMPLAQRIRDGVVITSAGCWEWQRRRLPNGYGVMSVGQRSLGEKRNAYVHRVAYESFVGPIPSGKDIDHLCRNRKCCNPEHLEPVTRSTNALRGLGPSLLAKINGANTHCVNGHPFDESNT